LLKASTQVHRSMVGIFLLMVKNSAFAALPSFIVNLEQPECP